MATGFTPLGGEFLVNTYITNHQNTSAIAALADGGYVITWASENQGTDTGGSFGAYGQRYDADGNTVGAEFNIETTGVGWQYLTDEGRQTSCNDR